MGVQDLLQWWNLIYAVPLFVSLVWIVATVVTGVHGHGDMGHTHDVGHGIGQELGQAAHDMSQAIGHAIHHHTDISGGHAHAGGDAAHGHDQSHEADAVARMLMLLGIGQVPITLVIGIFLLCWGAFGIIVNKTLVPVMRYPAVYIWPSLGLTFLASAVFTRVLAAVAGRLLPTSEETYGVHRHELVGYVGRTVFTTTENAGTVDIRDQYGTVHRVQARTEKGREPIPAGKDVVAVDFDDNDKRYVVRQGTP